MKVCVLYLCVLLFSWYHGKVSRDLAERCLKEVSFDCFLVRESEKRVGEYSLSLKHKGIVKHFRIDVKRGSRIRYELFGSQKSFPTLPDLIEYYSHHCITTVGETLTAPCPSEVHVCTHSLHVPLQIHAVARVCMKVAPYCIWLIPLILLIIVLIGKQ